MKRNDVALDGLVRATVLMELPRNESNNYTLYYGIIRGVDSTHVSLGYTHPVTPEHKGQGGAEAFETILRDGTVLYLSESDLIPPKVVRREDIRKVAKYRFTSEDCVGELMPGDDKRILRKIHSA